MSWVPSDLQTWVLYFDCYYRGRHLLLFHQLDGGQNPSQIACFRKDVKDILSRLALAGI